MASLGAGVGAHTPPTKLMLKNMKTFPPRLQDMLLYCKTLGGSHDEQNPRGLYRAVCGSRTARAWPWDGGHGVFHVLLLWCVYQHGTHNTFASRCGGSSGKQRGGGPSCGSGMSRSHDSPSFLRRPGTRPLFQPNLVQERTPTGRVLVS